MVKQKYKISISIGDYFADGVFIEGNDIAMAKVQTLPDDPTGNFLSCIKEGAKRLNISVPEMLNQTNDIRYSIAEPESILSSRSGSRIGLIVTKGYEKSFNVDENGSRPLGRFVPEDLVVGIEEQIDRSGKLIMEVERNEIFEAIKFLTERGVETVAICLKNSYYNPVNEQSVKQIIDTEVPDFYLGAIRVLCSHEVSGRAEDGHRLNTTVLSLYLHKNTARSLSRIEKELRASDFSKPLMIFRLNGGLARVAKTRPIDTWQGGSVARLEGSAFMSRLYDFDKVISTDMGGADFHLGMIINGGYEYQPESKIEGLVVDLPAGRNRLINAGGYSIAYVKKGGIEVGPNTTGLLPGPVCHDTGGTEPTVIDADAVLGYIGPEHFARGKKKLNIEEARKAIKEKIADPLNMTVEEAALGIVDIVNAYIGQKIVNELTLKGYDPKEFTLFACGSNGPTHCCGYAERAGVEKILTFPFGPAFSAFGCAVANIVHTYSHPINCKLFDAKQKVYFEDFDAFNNIAATLKENSSKDMKGEAFEQDADKFLLELLIKYEGGKERILGGIPKVFIDSREDAQAICDSFRKEYPDEKDKDRDIELVAMIGKVVRPFGNIEIPRYELVDKTPVNAVKNKRHVFWREGRIETTVYDYSRLQCGNVIEGPAVIEQEFATTLVPEGKKFLLDAYGNGIIENS